MLFDVDLLYLALVRLLWLVHWSLAISASFLLDNGSLFWGELITDDASNPTSARESRGVDLQVTSSATPGWDPCLALLMPIILTYFLYSLDLSYLLDY